MAFRALCEDADNLPCTDEQKQKLKTMSTGMNKAMDMMKAQGQSTQIQ